MSKCSDCAHLTLDSDVVEKEALFSQIMCVFCWMPLETSAVSQGSKAVQTLPLVSDCGHIFHGLCLECKERVYPYMPIRCPMDRLIMNKTKSLHVVKKLTPAKWFTRKWVLMMEVLIMIIDIGKRNC